MGEENEHDPIKTMSANCAEALQLIVNLQDLNLVKLLKGLLRPGDVRVAERPRVLADVVEVGPELRQYQQANATGSTRRSE